MKPIIMCLFTFLGLFGCKGYGDLKVDEFEKMIAEDASLQLVDVRTAEEYAAGKPTSTFATERFVTPESSTSHSSPSTSHTQ